MSKSNLQLNNQQRLQAERVTQTDHTGTQLVHIQGVHDIQCGVVPRHAPAFLKNGGSSNMKVDGSAADVLFDLAPGEGEILTISGLRFFMRCATAIGYLNFGDVAALAAGDGLLLQVIDLADASVRIDLLAGEEIRTTEDLLYFAEHFQIRDSNLHLVADIEPSSPIRLVGPVDGAGGHVLRATVRANLLGLTELAVIAKEAVREDLLG